MTKLPKILFLLAGLLFTQVVPFAFAQTLDEYASGKLILKINLLRNKQGQLCLSLFAGEEGFPSDGAKATLSKCFSLQDLAENNEFSIENLPVGNYSLAIFHDENNDKILNLGMFGIPLESFGFSNNPKIRFSAPRYADCSFNLIEGNFNLTIDLKSLRGHLSL